MKHFKGCGQLREGLVCPTEEFRFHLGSNGESVPYVGKVILIPLLIKLNGWNREVRNWAASSGKMLLP